MPTVQQSSNAIIENMADIYGYLHEKINSEGKPIRVITLRSETGQISCGCRFKNIAPEVELSYSALVEALNKAIDSIDSEFVTDERNQNPETIEKDYAKEFDVMQTKFQDLCGKLLEKDQSNALKITAITEKYLGRGRKVKDCNIDQFEHLELILIDMQDLLNK